MKWLEQRRQQSAFQDLPKQAQDLIAKGRAPPPRAALDIVREAYLFAETAHAGQTRASGEPYISHSVAVSSILVDLRLDPVTIAAALLHDVAEDTGVTLPQVSERFGVEIASLVDGVTKLGQIEWQSREERQAESLRKMFLAMANDIRIVLIKLTDRLHNMRTLQYLPEWKRQRTAPASASSATISARDRSRSTASGRKCSVLSTPGPPWPASTTGWACASSWTRCRSATLRWASCTGGGVPSRAHSTTTSPTPNPPATSRSTPR